ncbi:unnamed protein product [Dicrocoelium dendriticum]|nr:unnamed protein product [Dicrocoelium dendriticum]
MLWSQLDYLLSVFIHHRVRRLLALNTTQWAKLERLSHENRLLKSERARGEVVGQPGAMAHVRTSLPDANSTTSSDSPKENTFAPTNPCGIPLEVDIPGSNCLPDGAHPGHLFESHLAQLRFLEDRVRMLTEECNHLHFRLDEVINQKTELEIQCDRYLKNATMSESPTKCRPGRSLTLTRSRNHSSNSSEFSTERTDTEPSELLIQVRAESVSTGMECETHLMDSTVAYANGPPEELSTIGTEDTLRMAVSTLDGSL